MSWGGAQCISKLMGKYPNLNGLCLLDKIKLKRGDFLISYIVYLFIIRCQEIHIFLFQLSIERVHKSADVQFKETNKTCYFPNLMSHFLLLQSVWNMLEINSIHLTFI